jgi:hypothetical protein
VTHRPEKAEACAPYLALYELLRNDEFATTSDAWPAVAAWAVLVNANAERANNAPALRGMLLSAANTLNNREWDTFRLELRRHVVAAGQVWVSMAQGEREGLATSAEERLNRPRAFATADLDAVAVLSLFERRGEQVRTVSEVIRSRVALSAAIGIGVPSAEGPVLLPSEARRVASLLSDPVLAAFAAKTGPLPKDATGWAPAFDAAALSDLERIARREVRELAPGFAAKLTACTVPALVAACGNGHSLTEAQRSVLTADQEAVVSTIATRWPVGCPPLADEERNAVVVALAKRLREPAEDSLTDARAAGEARRLGSARTSRPTDPLACLVDDHGMMPPLGDAAPRHALTFRGTSLAEWTPPADACTAEAARADGTGRRRAGLPVSAHRGGTGAHPAGDAGQWPERHRCVFGDRAYLACA